MRPVAIAKKTRGRVNSKAKTYRLAWGRRGTRKRGGNEKEKGAKQNERRTLKKFQTKKRAGETKKTNPSSKGVKNDRGPREKPTDHIYLKKMKPKPGWTPLQAAQEKTPSA